MRAALLTALVLAGSPQAQDPENAGRPERELSSDRVAVDTVARSAWRLAAPRQALPGDAGRGLAPTARVVYALFPDRDARGRDALFVARSTDGGWSWPTPAVAVFVADPGLGEWLADAPQIVADGHRVFVGLCSNAGRPAGGDRALVVASADQGRTWQTVDVSAGIGQALSTGDTLNDCDDLQLAASGDGRAYVCFTADYTDVGGQGRASSREDVFFRSVGFDANGTAATLLPEERRVGNVPPGSLDSDSPSIAADGDRVCIAWLRAWRGADIPLVATSTDGGITWRPETGLAGRASGVRCAVDGQGVFVLVQDDALWMTVSRDGGASLHAPVAVASTPAGVPVLDARLLASGGRLVVLYTDARAGDADLYAVVDRRAGSDLLAGTPTRSLLLDVAGPVVLDQLAGTLDMRGRGTLAAALRTGPFPADATFLVSVDDAASWHRFDAVDNASRGATADVREVDVVTTLNGDVDVLYVHDGDGTRDVFVRGSRLPDLRLDAQGFLVVSLSDPAAVGSWLWFLPSLTAPVSNGIVLPAAPAGVVYDFAVDRLTFAALAQPTFFARTIDARGEARLDVRGFSALLGAPIHWIAIGADAATGLPTRGYSDPFEQR
ncbi:MAG: exo-alpha-sialidase [Planctomycetes bacterium]|nr:exo-alpha-sialidase [Planctomycetota bacterium]